MNGWSKNSPTSVSSGLSPTYLSCPRRGCGEVGLLLLHVAFQSCQEIPKSRVVALKQGLKSITPTFDVSLLYERFRQLQQRTDSIIQWDTSMVHIYHHVLEACDREYMCVQSKLLVRLDGRHPPALFPGSNGIQELLKKNICKCVHRCSPKIHKILRGAVYQSSVSVSHLASTDCTRLSSLQV